jgi:AAA domain
MIVIFLHGPPASGKYTVGKALSALLGVPLFHNHLAVDLARSLFEFGTPGFVKLREQVWLAAFEAAAATGQSFIFTFAPEATVDAELIARLESVIVRHGGRIHFIELRCSEATVQDRLANESRAAFGKLMDINLYRSIKEAGGFEFPPLPSPLLIVDSEIMSPDSAALAVQAALAGADLR